MKILAPKVEKNAEGEECNSFPDDAPKVYTRAEFKDGKYVFYEKGDAPTGK